MNDIFQKLRKKLKKDIEQGFEVDEGSDFPIHERHTKETDIQSIKAKSKKYVKK